MENSPRTKKNKFFEDDEENLGNFGNFNLELYSIDNQEYNKENVTDDFINIALGANPKLNINNYAIEECLKFDANNNDKEEEYDMLKQNCKFEVTIFIII